MCVQTNPPARVLFSSHSLYYYIIIILPLSCFFFSRITAIRKDRSAFISLCFALTAHQCPTALRCGVFRGTVTSSPSLFPLIECACTCIGTCRSAERCDVTPPFPPAPFFIYFFLYSACRPKPHTTSFSCVPFHFFFASLLRVPLRRAENIVLPRVISPVTPPLDLRFFLCFPSFLTCRSTHLFWVPDACFFASLFPRSSS